MEFGFYQVNKMFRSDVSEISQTGERMTIRLDKILNK